MAFPSPALFAPFPPQINYQRAQVPAEGSTSRGTMKKLLIGSQAAAARSRPNGDCAVTAGCSRPPGPLGCPSSAGGTGGQPGPAGPPADVTAASGPGEKCHARHPDWHPQPLHSPILGDTQALSPRATVLLGPEGLGGQPLARSSGETEAQRAPL